MRTADSSNETTREPYVIAEDGTRAPGISPAYADRSAIPIVTCFNRKYMPGAAALFASIADHASPERLYDLVVFTDDLTSNDRQKLRLCLLEKPNISLRFFDVTAYYSDFAIRGSGYFTKEAFYRLRIPEIMLSCDKVLYIDADTVTNRDVAELFDTPMDGHCIAAAPDMFYTLLGQIGADRNKKGAIQEIRRNGTYFNSGVILFNVQEMKATNASASIIRVMQEHEYRLMDQDILNIALAGATKFIDWKWNSLLFLEGDHRMPREFHAKIVEAKRDPYIVHFTGPVKPWHNADLNMAQHYWRYALKTPFYDELIENMHRGRQLHRMDIVRGSASVVRYILLPFGKRRKKRDAILNFARDRFA
jgi:lipopolysaccharide biosynthesis glycosyltransferase